MLQIIIATFVFCFLLERVFAGWKLPKVHTWYTRVILVNLVQIGVVVLAGLSWEHWLKASSVFHLSQKLSAPTAGFLAYFLATFVFYWWHRARHESDFLWRTFHQIHHSPQRLEVITSFYKHPQEMIVNSILGSLIIYTLLGLSPEAGAVYTLCTALGEFIYHTSVRTPQWMGYFFQRPEMHRLHHQYGYHKNNYGDFVIWDLIFGTYENPKTWDGRCGFDEALELRLGDMLRFKDVHKIAAESPADSTVELAANLAEGDLIFLDIPNFVFRAVAESTRSWTSHVGIIFKNAKGEWVVRESKIPISKEVHLKDYIARSAEGRYEIKRLRRQLTSGELERLRTTSSHQLGRLYNLGFDLDSQNLFCSKFVLNTYRAIGVDVGRVQSFRELLDENPNSGSVRFWRAWFFGFIPWDRKTVTPASQLADPQFMSVI